MAQQKQKPICIKMAGHTFTSLRLLFLISTLGFHHVHAQDGVQRFGVHDMIKPDVGLNFVLGKLKKESEFEATKLILVRFYGDGTIKFIWVKEADEKKAAEVGIDDDPFAAMEERRKKLDRGYDGEYKFTVGSIKTEDSPKEPDAKLAWKKLKDKSLITDSISCASKTADQEVNSLRVAMRGGLTLYVFVKIRLDFFGGKIINPIDKTKTFRLMEDVDRFIKLNAEMSPNF